MTVAELIKELNELCEGRDPASVEVCKMAPSDDMWGADYEPVNLLETAGGNLYPFTILIK
jgi:hypothetical protein